MTRPSPRGLLSLLLACTLLAGLLAVPASASGGFFVSVTKADGSTLSLSRTNPIELHTFGRKDVASVSVNGRTYTDLRSPITDTTASGATTYELYTKTENAVRKLYFRHISTLNETIRITVTGQDAFYSVTANSGPYGENGNQGGSPTCTVSRQAAPANLQDGKIRGGTAWTVTFTPQNGLELYRLNLRTGFSDAQGQLVEPVNGTVTVGSQTLVLERSGRSLVIRAESAMEDLFLTALTRKEVPRHTLTVTVDAHCSTATPRVQVEEGSAQTVTLTPEKNWGLTSLTIAAGTGRETLRGTSSGKVDGKLYTATWNLDGTVTLAVPAMTTDVSVSATSASCARSVQVDSAPGLDCEEAGSWILERGTEKTVTFAVADEDLVALQGIDIRTPEGLFSADAGDSSILVNGTPLRMKTNRYGDITLFLKDLPSSLHIRPVTETLAAAFSVVPDRNTRTDHAKKEAVPIGEDHSVTFSPVTDLYAVRTLTVLCDGKEYTADAADSCLRIAGERHPITRSEDGSVTFTFVNLQHDVTVKASSDLAQSGSYSITKKNDAHSTIRFTGRNPFPFGTSTTLTVTPLQGWYLDFVELSTKTGSVKIGGFTESFQLDGRTYEVDHQEDGSLRIVLRTLYQDLTVRSVSTREAPADPASSTVHTAYMEGIGGGRFAPLATMSRAEAVTLLVRLYCPQDSAGSSGSSGYTDVPSSAWYAPWISIASARNLLDVLGTQDTFRPEAPITRAELLALLCSFTHSSVNQMPAIRIFSDVDPSHWAIRCINYGATLGWVLGCGDGTFKPDTSITRAEVTALVNRVSGRHPGPSLQIPSPFSDVSPSFWGYADILEAAITHTVADPAASPEVWVS